jgi:2-phosphosulfolactate phosphatase
MKPSPLNVLFTPADFEALGSEDLSGTICVVFDVLRATSTMITALDNGAEAIFPVSTIPEALEIRRQIPGVLLGGERDGVRIRSDLTGSIDFDFGNSPRECSREKVSGKRLVMTTTNGTRALRACDGSQATLAACFLNLKATADWLLAQEPERLILVCSGTYEETAYEDILGAGALCDSVWSIFGDENLSDSARTAREVFRLEKAHLADALGRSKNGRRLLKHPELNGDVAFCAQQDTCGLIAHVCPDGWIRRRS